MAYVAMAFDWRRLCEPTEGTEIRLVIPTIEADHR